MTKHLVIPDTQCKPNQTYDHLAWAGQYAADKKPDTIIHLGDHWDMPSLSSWDIGKKSFEGRRYTDDIEAGHAGMQAFLTPIRAEQRRLRQNRKKVWNPRMVFLIGNHVILISGLKAQLLPALFVHRSTPPACDIEPMCQSLATGSCW